MDIVDRLRQPMAWAKVWGGTVQADTAPTEAADEIERLRAKLAEKEKTIADIFASGDLH